MGNTGHVSTPRLRYPKVGEPRARDWNMMWQPMQVLLFSRDQEAWMNPVPVIDSKNGTILLLVNRVSRYGEDEDKGKGVTEVWLLKSKDEGATWSKPENITPETGQIALGPGIGIRMKSGRLVVPVYDGVVYSDDDGVTWAHGNITTGPVSECQVVELTDGSLMLNTRGYPYRTVVISNDSGESWGTPVKDYTLTDSELYGGCQASLIRYTRKDEGYDKTRLLFSHPADTAYRFNLLVRMSYDEGKTWPVSKLIKKGTAAYSCLTIFPDGSIGVIYETGNCNNDFPEYYANLSFARFNIEWLTNSGDQLQPVKND
jgi:sialidase-1